ncbi:2-amino-4-hydroxy-6-hydroxymethyldihydropteridine diphosphokinase [Amnibacterium flavum]|uniref:Bifunctional folate synthesis protein n=1 Tax=Amnibacterium flavum TaxID=2173173 RepID=A0A2V1HVT2_9MICO|nr:2-amino-4-hydroxy-6-hydroxymethyldihydropteridine diphosphokinase [Amnibacterium flavum]PVZ95219.1 2-amino-4-hydroxy-6-hydroxymethyldihydropteridine diphosphokinase [Amnibacterium flavum]
MSADRITLTGLRAFGRHGVYAHEREQGQEFIADLTLELSLERAALTDDVVDTVHYGELAEKVSAVIAGEPVALIETLAERIASVALGYELVDRVHVTVHKPSAPITVPFADVSVTLDRTAEHRVVLALGSNLGDRVAYLGQALDAVASIPGIVVVRRSPIVESVALTPHGLDDGRPAYLNQVALARTSLAPLALLERLQTVEERLGRQRTERWGDRTIDLDIVSYDAERSDDARLTLPHPGAAERAFVLVPWLAVDPDAELPGLGRVDGIASRLSDQVTVVTE